MIDHISEIKSRITIQELVGRYVQLNKQDKALCPFHQEKTPSFSINRKRQIFKCFGCQEGGDVIEFYEKYFRVDKKTAINELYESIYGTTVRKTGFIPTVKPESSSFLDDLDEDEKYFYYEKLGISNEKQAFKELKFYRLKKNVEVFNELRLYSIKKSNIVSKKAFNYLINDRKLRIEWLERFCVFVIDNYFETSNHLKKTFPISQLIKSGLFNQKGNLIFFKHKIIIPYLFHGKMVYLRARYFEDSGNTHPDQASKYMGLADDSLGLNTAKRFYNSDIFKTSLQWERLYITEGELDTIALSGLGRNSIAIPGAGNLPKMNRFKQLLPHEIIYCGDNDKAGNELMKRITEIFASLNKEIYYKDLGAKDINEFLIQYENHHYS